MNFVAIIPAKGNSKGLKDKNLRKVGRKSLLERSIIELKKSKYIDDIFVSSESDKILRYSLEKKCKIIKRPNKLSSKTATSESVLLHAINEIKRNNLKLPSFICFVQCTSPFQKASDIDNAFKYLKKNKNDSVFSATRFYSNLWIKNKTHTTPLGHNPKKRKIRQNVNNLYRENGAFYIFKTKNFLNTKSRFCLKPAPYLSNFFSQYEIDDEIDLMLSNIICKKFKL